MAAAHENKALEAAKKGKQALAGLMTPLLLAAPALATEGTGEVRIGLGGVCCPCLPVLSWDGRLRCWSSSVIGLCGDALSDLIRDDCHCG